MSHTATVSTVPIKDIRALTRCVEELKAKGVNVELVQNAVPRMYYANQIRLHLKEKGKKLQYHPNVEECDYVLKVNDAYYDVGFLKDEKGNLVPLFDDYDYSSWEVKSTQSGKGPIRKYIGAKFDAPIEHWSGEKQDTEQLLHSVGDFLQAYTKHATIYAAEDEGYSLADTSLNEKGELVLEFEVQ
jgi:hypothetical protein